MAQRKKAPAPEQPPPPPEPAPEATSTTYRQEMIKCGKALCRKCADGQRGHGPYWYAYTHKDGKTTKKYIGKTAPAGTIKTTSLQIPLPERAEPQPPASRSSRRAAKQPVLHFWLIEQTDADYLAFATREQAEKWAGRINVKTRIYEADNREEAFNQHRKFMTAWANGNAIWN